MKLDLARSLEELAGQVAERCSTLGAVIKVTIHPARSGSPARPFAIVSMETRAGAESVAAALGGRTVGNSVVVFVEQPAKPVFQSMPAGKPADNAAIRSSSHRE